MTMFDEALEAAYLSNAPMELKAIALRYPILAAAPQLLKACKAAEKYLYDLDKSSPIHSLIKAALAATEVKQ